MRTEVVVFSVLFVVAGLVIGVWVIPGEWSLVARILMGLALAATGVITLFANRLIGGKDFD